MPFFTLASEAPGEWSLISVGGGGSAAASDSSRSAMMAWVTVRSSVTPVCSGRKCIAISPSKPSDSISVQCGNTMAMPSGCQSSRVYGAGHANSASTSAASFSVRKRSGLYIASPHFHGDAAGDVVARCLEVLELAAEDRLDLVARRIEHVRAVLGDPGLEWIERIGHEAEVITAGDRLVDPRPIYRVPELVGDGAPVADGVAGFEECTVAVLDRTPLRRAQDVDATRVLAHDGDAEAAIGAARGDGVDVFERAGDRGGLALGE